MADGEVFDSDRYEYAGFWIRVAAAIVDSIIFLAIAGMPLTIIYGEAYWASDAIIHGVWDVILSYIFPFLVTVWLWVRYFATPGKMAFRLKLLDAESGEAVSTGKAIARYLAYMLSALPMMLGFIWVGVDRRKQGFHDKLCSTVVVRDLKKEKVDFS